MSASYPLVRNLSAFSTRFGVWRNPSRLGSSPSSPSSCLMSSCILLFYICVAATPEAESLASGPRVVALRGGAPRATPEAESLRSRPRSLALGGGAPSAIEIDPNALYRDRAHLPSARQAAELWQAELERNPRAFDAAWRLARADYWLGGHAPEKERRTLFESGIEAGRKAVALEPNRPAGHFWNAANIGALAESFGLGAGTNYTKPTREEPGRVLRP